jgi:hypothetical protein
LHHVGYYNTVITAIHDGKWRRQAELRSEKLEEKYLEYLNADGRINIKLYPKEFNWKDMC